MLLAWREFSLENRLAGIGYLCFPNGQSVSRLALLNTEADPRTFLAVVKLTGLGSRAGPSGNS
jgi:hypothetical protein